MADILFNLPSFAETSRFYVSLQKTLEDITYTFTIQYLSRQDRYIMSIGDKAKGIAIQGGVDMLAQLHYLDVPPGKLELHYYDGLVRDPTRTTFGDRITFKYIEST